MNKNLTQSLQALTAYYKSVFTTPAAAARQERADSLAAMRHKLAQMEHDLAAAETALGRKYNPDQPRDDHGRWSSGGASHDGSNPGPGTQVADSGQTATDAQVDGQTIPRVTATSTSTTIQNPDGTSETRTGGSVAWRNNNPGNIRNGNFADTHGAVGSNNGFAVFPDEATGRAAVSALLQTSVYSNSTIDDAIAIYAPGSENNVGLNQRTIRSIGGFSGSEIVGSLSQDRFSDLVNAITRNEGWIPGTVTRTP